MWTRLKIHWQQTAVRSQLVSCLLDGRNVNLIKEILQYHSIVHMASAALATSYKTWRIGKTNSTCDSPIEKTTSTCDWQIGKMSTTCDWQIGKTSTTCDWQIGKTSSICQRPIGKIKSSCDWLIGDEFHLWLAAGRQSSNLPHNPLNGLFCLCKWFYGKKKCPNWNET